MGKTEAFVQQKICQKELSLINDLEPSNHLSPLQLFRIGVGC